MSIKKEIIYNQAKADSLMKESNKKKYLANQQEKIGKAFIKAGKGNDVFVLDLKGTTTPTAYERLEIAKKARESAKTDSLNAIKIIQAKQKINKNGNNSNK